MSFPRNVQGIDVLTNPNTLTTTFRGKLNPRSNASSPNPTHSALTVHELPWSGDPADIVAAADAEVVELLRERLRGLIPKWHADAACAGSDPDLYYPDRGAHPHHAIETCNTCPVRQPCLDEALADPTLDYGIRGGMTAHARRTLRTRGTGHAKA